MSAVPAQHCAVPVPAPIPTPFLHGSAVTSTAGMTLGWHQPPWAVAGPSACLALAAQMQSLPPACPLCTGQSSLSSAPGAGHRQDKMQRLLSFCGRMLRGDKSSPRAAQQNGDSQRGLSVRAAPRADAASAQLGVLSPMGRARVWQPSRGFQSRTAPAAPGKLGEPLPRARVCLGGWLLEPREGGWIHRHAGFPLEATSDYGSKQGMEKESYPHRLCDVGRGLC